MRSLAAWSLALVALVVAVSAPRVAEAEAEAAEYGVLAADAVLRTAASKDAAQIALKGASTRSSGFEVEVIGVVGEFYKVRNQAETRCYKIFETVSDIAMTMYVAKDELRVVLTEPVSLDLGGGQRLEALPGTLVDDGSLLENGFSVALDLPKSLLGKTYQRSGTLPKAAGVSARLVAGQWRIGEIEIASASPQSITLDNAGGASTAILAGECVQASFRVGDAQVEKTSTDRSWGGFGLSNSPRWVISKGTSLDWAGTGTAAARYEIRIDDSLSDAKGGRKCFGRSVGSEKVQMCVKARSLKKGSKADLGGGVLGGVIGPGLSVQLSTLSLTSGLRRSDVQTLIDAQMKRVAKCHASAKRNGKTIPGRMTISWNVDKKGRSTNTVAGADSTGSAKLATCIVRVFRKIKFPVPATAPVVGSQALTFFAR